MIHIIINPGVLIRAQKKLKFFPHCCLVNGLNLGVMLLVGRICRGGGQVLPMMAYTGFWYMTG